MAKAKAKAKIGVIHYNFPGFTWEQFLDYCVKTGFEYMEVGIGVVWDKDVADPKPKAKEVRKQIDDRGLKVSALSSGNDFVLLDPAAIQAQIERMKVICCEVAPLLGTDTIRTEGGWQKDAVPPEKYADAIAGCLRQCVPFIEPAGIRLAVDNHGHVTNDADLQVKIFGMVGSKNVGSNLDTMNYRWAGHDLATIDRYYELIAPHVFHTHMKDGTGSLANYKGAALGDGEIHLARAIACLKKVGYNGVWCAEYEGPEAADGVGYAKCQKWLKAHV